MIVALALLALGANGLLGTLANLAGMLEKELVRKPPQEKRVTVAIDPGHGGELPGAHYYGVLEKDINLSVSLKVEKLLKDKGYGVLMTRTDDTDVSLERRVAMANASDARLFVSVHANALENDTATNGILSYYYHDDDASLALADLLTQCAGEKTGAGRMDSRWEDLYVVRHVQMPAALIEMGFMTNEAECAKLAGDTYQDQLAAGIVSAIEEYINTYVIEG